MPTPTVRMLLARRELGLTLLTPTDSTTATRLDAEVSWVHSSDLVDPTPFLAPGQVLLTTGTQFDRGTGARMNAEPRANSAPKRSRTPHDDASASGFNADSDSGSHSDPDSDLDSDSHSEPDSGSESGYDGYIARLVSTGVVALGFGTEVVRTTPPALIAACTSYGLPLLEVPYRTPFIAVARYAADLMAEQAYARNTWALSAQRALSLAALRSDGLAATLAELARQLGGWVALTDAAGTIQRVFPTKALSGSARADIETEAKRMLRARRRAASNVVEAGTTASLQTIGASDRLLGVLAHGGNEDADQATQQVVTSVVALAGLALEQGHAVDAARSAVRAALVRALDDVRALAHESDSLSVSEVAALRAARLRVDAELQRTPMAAVGATSMDTTAAPADGPNTGSASGSPAASRESGSRAAGMIPKGDDPQIRSRATALLAPLTTRDPEGVLARSLLVWLEHNGVYDSAARELGVHRHTLTARIRSAGRLLGRDFGTFADRAEVWTALRAVGLSS
ncbi:PucR family transcriptional regulator ligand-binding domain-containing protein [Rathayibacter sp. CAU 1779]